MLPRGKAWWLNKDNPNERLRGKHASIDERDIDTANPMNELLWFELHQPLLLEMGNTVAGRDLLCIEHLDMQLVELRKNKAVFLLGFAPDGTAQIVHQFYIGAKFGNVIRNRWREFKQMASSFYKIDIGGGHTILKPLLRYREELVAAATTNTFYPEAHIESTTADGWSRQCKHGILPRMQYRYP